MRILISIFGKGFAKHAFNSEKINFEVKRDRFTFSFLRCLPIFKETVVSLPALIPRSNVFQETVNRFVIWFWV